MQDLIWRAGRTAKDRSAVGAADMSDALLNRTSTLLFDQGPVAMALADPTLPDCPVVRVNQAFTRLTGYPSSEVVGRNCRFLQGPRTDAATVEAIGAAARAGREGQFEVLNYRRDHTPFWNGLRIAPIRDDGGRLRYICATQTDLSELHMAREAEANAAMRAREVGHRIKNAFQTIESMVKLSARGAQVPGLVDKIATRVRAISNANAAVLDQPYSAAIPVAHVVRDVLDPYQGSGGAARIAVAGPTVRIFPGTVSVLALVLNELAGKAMRYGALADPGGQVSLSWTVAAADLDQATEVAFDWLEAARGPIASPQRGGEGSATIDTLLAAAGGRIERRWHPTGLRARIVLPRER